MSRKKTTAGQDADNEEDSLGSSITASLSLARIPMAFHAKDITFAKYDPGCVTRADWKKQLAEFGLGGQVAVVCGANSKSPSLEATFTLARAMVLSGVAVRCYSLPVLAELCMSKVDSEQMDELMEAECVVVLGFYDPHYRQSPLVQETAHKMEWFIEGMLGRGQSLVLHCAGGHTSTSKSLPTVVTDWWPPRLVSRLERQIQTNNFIIR